jgi:RNA-directed DNA polymerase
VGHSVQFTATTFAGKIAVSYTKPYDYTLEEVAEAFEIVKANRGAAGVDHQSLQEFEERLVSNTYKVFNRLASGSYFPPPIRAVTIPKKTGGERVLGIPTVADRVAQTVIKRRLEPQLEPIFHVDSYGFRPNKSAHQALAVTRKRCWQYRYVVEFDIARAFDAIDHQLLLKALRHHGIEKNILMYVERWLRAPLQREDGTMELRSNGTPQGGVISPLLANLFFHYAFDAWMCRTFSELPFCRYADDAIIHCRNLAEARRVLTALALRLKECGLEIHSGKTHIVCCKPGMLRDDDVEMSFTFLGYTFRPRCCASPGTRKLFTGFVPAMSAAAEKSVRASMREFPFVTKRFLSLQDISKHSRPYIQGWINYYGRFFGTQFRRVSSYFNSLLVRWAMSKFKKFRGERGRARLWLAKIAAENPDLFPHWKLGWTTMVG